ncbi:RING finger and CCCH-type zinc finger domain-containing protein roquin [Musca autumnalis]|uniref:RING finger and CCCH-type zinc finger domain-containing protein roquin n=1 Tax=Musca autumnalis TaxID=221902 RepID=UPI003CEC3385
MPFQAPSWTEFYTCPICENEFSTNQRLPISLGCGHTICRVCLSTLYSRQCPFDQTSITTDVDNLPINNALLQLLNSGDGNDNGNASNVKANSSSSGVGASTSNTSSNTKNSTNTNKTFGGGGGGGVSSENDCAAGDQHMPPSVRNLKPDDLKSYKSSKKCIEDLAQYLKSFVTNSGNPLLTRPMLRKLVTLVNCQLMEEEGRIRAVRTARFLGERTVTELLLQHQNPQQLSLCLWAAVRSRGCQFLGPSMQEEVLKLVLQALQNGSALSRKVLVMYVVQRLIDSSLPASKTSIGHVVQLLYRASCFKVSKREGDSSLMQLKEEFRNYEALRREHDAQIVQIATEAGLRIAPDQWSSLLYGNTSHKSHMQSICDTLQTPSSFAQSVQELVLALQRTGDPTNLSSLRPQLKHLASIDPSPESPPPTWQEVEKALEAVRFVVLGLVKFMQYHSNRKVQDYPTPPMNANGKYKISLCRDLTERRMCPRGPNCTFAHSAEERQRYRAKHRRTGPGDKSMIRPHTVAGVPAGGQLENIKNEYSKNQSQHSTNNVVPSHPLQQTLTLSNTMDNGNSPIKMKSSPMRKYSNNETSGGNIGIAMRPNMMDSTAYMGELSNTTSPLSMQGPHNALHSSPIPQHGHLLGINAPTSIINVPPMHKHPSNYDGMPYGAINYGGKYMRMPNMGMPMPPNMRPHNIRGPISNSGIMTAGGAVGGISGHGIPSPRSSVHNPLNVTTVVNPPNLQGTNSNKPSGSPLHKNIFNNSTMPPVEYFNSGHPISFFGNANNTEAMPTGSGGDIPMRMAKTKMQKVAPNTMWDVHNQQSCQPPLLNPSEYAPNHNQPMYMTPPPPTQPHQLSTQRPPLDANVFFDKNPPEYNNNKSTANLVDPPLNMPENFMFKGKNFLEGSGATLKDPGRVKNKNPVTLHDKTNPFWNISNNNEQQSNNSGGIPYIKTINGVNIEPPSPSTTLFRDRENFVRSDSILDDDATTFDVPPTSTSALGNKYGPICPMYKGLASSSSMAQSTNNSTNTFVDSWNALISQDNDNMLPTSNSNRNSNNGNDFTVFTLDNSDPLGMSLSKHATSQSSDTFMDNVADIAASGTQTSSQTTTNTFVDNYENMQAALSKLSFLNDSTGVEEHDQQQQQLNRFSFDLNPLYQILGGNNYESDITKNPVLNNDLLWNNATLNNSKHSTSMNLGLNSFWSDDANVTSTSASNVTPTTSKTLMSSSNNLSRQHPQQNQQQEQCKSQKLDDPEFDITEIVDKMWPSGGDDSGIKLE